VVGGERRGGCDREKARGREREKVRKRKGGGGVGGRESERAAARDVGIAGWQPHRGV